MVLLSRILVIALLWLALPQASAAVPTQEVDASERAARLERWRSLGPERRAELERRMEKLGKLAPEERARILERGQRLRSEMRRALESLPPGRRAWVESLDEDKRARVLRGMLVDRAKGAASRIRERLTPDERARLENASPLERAQLLRAVREREFARLPAALERLGRELGVGPEGLQRLAQEDPKRARALVIDYVRRRAKKRTERDGPPAGVDAEEWARVLELPDGAFARAYPRYTSALRGRGMSWGRSVSPRGARRGEAGRDPRGQRTPLARALDGFSTPSLEARARAGGLREIELRRLTLLERRALVEAFLVESLELTAEEHDALAALDDDDFLRVGLRAKRASMKGEDPRRMVQRMLSRARREAANRPAPGTKGADGRRPPR